MVEKSLLTDLRQHGVHRPSRRQPRCRAAGESIIKLPTLGGSLPLYLFANDLQKPVMIAPIANHDDNQHAPDENIHLANLWYGIDLMGAIFTMPP